MTLVERFDSPGPKRILTLDGGGIRGAITVGYLARMESILRKRHGDADLRLCDYFDLIAGTSTGAIIAALLAIGKDTAEIKKLYLELGGEIFKESRSWWKPWQIEEKLEASFDEKPLIKQLKRLFGDRELGSDMPDVRTGLCIVTKRADTQSTWPLINHPRAKYFKHNEAIPLWSAVRASTAAPTYFVPERVDVGQGQEGAFVDGGVSMANNPALQALMVAWLEGFPFHWAKGADNLLLVSLGTGHWSNTRPTDEVLDSKLWNWATAIPGMLMEDASWQNQLLLQWMSSSPTAMEIDGEIGDLGNDSLGAQPLISYLRYDVEMSKKGLEGLGVPDLAAKAEDLREMSDAGNRYDLAKLGEAAAAKIVEEGHFPASFDLGSQERSAGG